jgi:hypothetical protein
VRRPDLQRVHPWPLLRKDLARAFIQRQRESGMPAI